MKVCALHCALLAAVFLIGATASLEAAPAAGQSKLGASGQVYSWQSGTC